MEEMRKVYTNTLVDLAKKDTNIVILDADLSVANGTKAFYEQFPERSFNIGAGEANMVGIAAGLSTVGKIPFASTFACFASRRVYDQFFLSCNFAKLNVKLTGTDPGITATNNGGTHMAFEDIGLMRMIPDIVILEPSDNISLRALLPQAAYHNGSTYMRIDRKSSPVFYNEHENFELGKGKVVQDGTDLTIVAAGIIMVPEAQKAASKLEEAGVSAAVIDMHTIKPLDKGLILEYAAKTRLMITCENHQIIGGLGSAVAEVLSESMPTPLQRVGVNGVFGQVGDLSFLKQHFGMNADHIFTVCRDAIQRWK
jgi:transketolase